MKKTEKYKRNFQCPKCYKLFTRNDNLKHHINSFCYSKQQENGISPLAPKQILLQNNTIINSNDCENHMDVISNSSTSNDVTSDKLKQYNKDNFNLKIIKNITVK